MSAALLILGHGSRNPAASQQFMEIVEQIRAQYDDPVYPAFMELAEPSLPDAVAEAVASGATEIIVQPCFLFDGIHIRVDIPEMLAELSLAHPTATFSFGRPLGADPRVVEILLERSEGATCLG